MTDRILVTGASGFVGRTIVRTLSDQANVYVIAIVRYLEKAPPGADVVEKADITRIDDLASIINRTRPTVIINAAVYGVSPDERDFDRSIGVNTLGAIDLLRMASDAGCRRYIQLGSCSEYGNQDGRIREDVLPYPNSPYGSSKAAATLLLQERGIRLNMQVLVLRLFNVWGEHEPKHRLFPSLLEARETGQRIELTSGSQMKDYSYIGDVADWVVSFAVREDSRDEGVVNVASGECRPLRDFIVEIAECLGIVDLLEFGAKHDRPEEPRNQVPDVGRLNSLLPNRPITPVEIAVETALRHTSNRTRPHGS